MINLLLVDLFSSTACSHTQALDTTKLIYFNSKTTYDLADRKYKKLYKY